MSLWRPGAFTSDLHTAVGTVSPFFASKVLPTQTVQAHWAILLLVEAQLGKVDLPEEFEVQALGPDEPGGCGLSSALCGVPVLVI